MNGLDERGIAREGLQRGRLIPPEEHRDIVLLHVQRGKVEPRQRVFEVAPDPLNRVQLRTIGRQEHQAHVFRQGQPLGGMRPTVVQQQEIQAIGKGLREQSTKIWKSSAFRYGSSRKNRSPVVGSTAP